MLLLPPNYFVVLNWMVYTNIMPDDTASKKVASVGLNEPYVENKNN